MSCEIYRVQYKSLHFNDTLEYLNCFIQILRISLKANGGIIATLARSSTQRPTQGPCALPHSRTCATLSLSPPIHRSHAHPIFHLIQPSPQQALLLLAHLDNILIFLRQNLLVRDAIKLAAVSETGVNNAQDGGSKRAQADEDDEGRGVRVLDPEAEIDL